MRLRFYVPEIVLGIFLAVAVFGMGMLFGSSGHQPTQAQPNQHAATTDAQKNAPIHPPKPFTRAWYLHDATGFFTIALVLVVGAQAILLIWQLFLINRTMRDQAKATQAAGLAAKAASDQVKINRVALTDTNRAYVFVSKTHQMAGIKKSTNAVVDWTFFTIFENSGNTPTRFMRMHTSWRWFKPGMPSDFDFADAGGIAAEDRPPMTLGPKATTWSGESVIPLDVLEQARKKELEVFLYGWVEYDDIFEGTLRHRTEYCTRIMVEGDPTIHMISGNPDTPHDPFFRQGHKKHNGADEECMRPLQTGSPKNPLN